MPLFERVGKHWLLLVIDMHQKCFSVFDSASYVRNDQIEPQLQSAVSVQMRCGECGPI